MATKKTIRINGIDLIKELNLGNLPAQKQAELLGEMTDIVQNRILLRAASGLTEKQAIKLNGLLDGGEEKNILGFLRKNVPNFTNLMKGEIKKFGEEMLKSARPE